MIKVELAKNKTGNEELHFETNKPTDTDELDMLDSVLRLVASRTPVRGGFAKSGYLILEFKTNSQEG